MTEISKRLNLNSASSKKSSLYLFQHSLYVFSPLPRSPLLWLLMAIYRYFWGVTNPLNLSIMRIYSPLCEEKVGVIDPVNYCLLQQKHGSHVRHKPHFGVGTRGSQARVSVETQSLQACVLTLKHDPEVCVLKKQCGLHIF